MIDSQKDFYLGVGVAFAIVTFLIGIVYILLR